jgi:hypothetical protein
VSRCICIRMRKGGIAICNADLSVTVVVRSLSPTSIKWLVEPSVMGHCKALEELGKIGYVGWMSYTLVDSEIESTIQAANC